MLDPLLSPILQPGEGSKPLREPLAAFMGTTHYCLNLHYT